jgi:WD40 repeat protein
MCGIPAVRTSVTLSLGMMLLVWTHSVIASSPVTALAVSPDGTQLVTGSQAGIDVRAMKDLVDDKTISDNMDRISANMEHVHDLRFSPDGHWLLVAGGSPAEKGIVALFSWPKMVFEKKIELHADVVFRVAWSSDSKQFGTASADHTCAIVNTHTLEVATRFAGHSKPVLAIQFLPGDQRVASAGVDQSIRIWDSMDGKPGRVLDNHVGIVNGLEVASNPTTTSFLVSISEDRTVRFWQVETGRMLRFAKLTSVPRAVTWIQDLQVFCVGCNDGVVRSIDLSAAEMVGERAGNVERIHEIMNHRSAEHIIIAGAKGIGLIVKSALRDSTH